MFVFKCLFFFTMLSHLLSRFVVSPMFVVKTLQIKSFNLHSTHPDLDDGERLHFPFRLSHIRRRKMNMAQLTMS